MEKQREYCKCGGAGGYLLQGGELVCQSCGGLSPKSRLSGEKFIKIGDSEVKCPQCGYVLQKARPDLKIDKHTEDKMAAPPENKQAKAPNKRR